MTPPGPGPTQAKVGEPLPVAAYCLLQRLDELEQQGQQGPPPWAPGRREEIIDVQPGQSGPQDPWCLSEVDIFADLSEPEMEQIAAAAPMKSYAAGNIIFSPHQPTEALFILKRGRVRIFRVSPDGRALTTAIITPGTIFGEMAPLGQRMHDNFAEALDDSIVCVMSRADVQKFLMSDPRIAARISEILGARVAELERRLSDTVFKSAPQRIATTLCLLAGEQQRYRLRRGTQVALTHEQIAALTGTSRETTTKVLDEYANRGLLRLARGKVTILDPDRVAAEAGD